MSVRSRTASRSSCLILPATSCGSFPLTRPDGRLLQKPTSGKEETLVRPQGEPVRHTGDVVGDMGRRVARRTMVLRRDVLWVVEVVTDERPDYRDGLLLLRASVIAKIDPF